MVNRGSPAPLVNRITSPAPSLKSAMRAFSTFSPVHQTRMYPSGGSTVLSGKTHSRSSRSERPQPEMSCSWVEVLCSST